MQLLCATDFSAPAKAAADVAAVLAKKLTLPLRLLHCGQDWAVMGDLPVADPGDDKDQALLMAEASRLRATGVDAVEDFRRGSPGTEIIAATRELPTRLVVIGSAGRGSAECWLIGSVAERVAESAPVPTLVVRRPESLQAWLSEEASLPLLCAVDFSTSADTAAAAARTFILTGRVEVHAAHIRRDELPPATPEQTAVDEKDLQQRLRPSLGETSARAHISYAFGQPATAFLQIAEECGSGLIVVGTHQRHGLHRLQAPSFSRAVLTHAGTNVFCVPAMASPQAGQSYALSRVLVATDFSSVLASTLRYACNLLPFGGSLHLVHVCPGPISGINPLIGSIVDIEEGNPSSTAKREAELQIKNLPPSLTRIPGVCFSHEVMTSNDVPGAICQAAERFHADVICMGTHARSRIAAAMLGSTVQGVLLRAHKPVFIATPVGP